MITGAATSEWYSLQFSKNYEIPTNVTDKNMNFITKCVHIVDSVSKMFRVNSIVDSASCEWK